MKKNIGINFIPLHRPGCVFRRVSSTKYEVVVNNRREIIELDSSVAELLSILLPSIDNTKSLKDIVPLVRKRCQLKYTVEDIEYLVSKLFSWGLISGIDINTTPRMSKRPQISFLSSFTSYPREMQSKLTTANVGLIGGKYISPIILRSLFSSGVRNLTLIGDNKVEAEELEYYWSRNHKPNSTRIRALSKEADFLRYGMNLEIVGDTNEKSTFYEAIKKLKLIMVLMPGLEAANIRAINNSCLFANTAMLFGGISSSSFIFGPLVFPHQSACLTCRELRFTEEHMVLSEDVETSSDSPYYSRFNKDISTLNPFMISFCNILVGYACLYIMDLSSMLLNHELEYDFINGIFAKHYILKLPRCPSCGNQLKGPGYKAL